MRRLAVGTAVFGIAFVALSWAVANDKEIAREITDKLSNEKASGHLQGFDIKLQVSDGTVLLKGHVASREQQRLALDVARNIQGVTQVVNDLHIEAAGALSDREIADAIARELSLHKAAGRLVGFRISVDVIDGAATLKGTVSSSEQKKLAQETAASVAGIRGVVDQLVVEGTEKTEEIAISDEPSAESKPAIADAEIAEKVSDALNRLQESGQLRGFSIDMTVQDGIVTYKGHVSREEQIALAMEAAHKVEGVKDIVSELLVSGTEVGDQAEP
ncbi:MAG: BON domain-containing protein, partial [Planctomycetes bacterium]|nr:BON domain-containing protein [Planctomycetota bacterium]